MLLPHLCWQHLCCMLLPHLAGRCAPRCSPTQLACGRASEEQVQRVQSLAEGRGPHWGEGLTRVLLRGQLPVWCTTDCPHLLSTGASSESGHTANLKWKASPTAKPSTVRLHRLPPGVVRSRAGARP